LGDIGGITAGELTTDSTATNLFWKGSRLNAQGGGGLSIDTLTSTVAGLGQAGYVSTSQLGSTTTSLLESIQNWAIYPAQSSIVFANETPGTFNSIIANGGTILKLQTDSGVISLTSNDIAKPFVGSELILVDSFPGSYSHSLTAGTTLTGEISTATFITVDSNVASLYLSTLFLGNTGGTRYGEITVNPTSRLLFNGSELAYMSTVFSTTTGLVNYINMINIVSTANLQGLISTANLQGLISTANLQGLISTANLRGLISTANLLGLISTANLQGLISTANLQGLISTANLQGLISTANLLGFTSTANLVNLVSTVNLVGGIAFNNLSTVFISAAAVSANTLYASTLFTRTQRFIDLGTTTIGDTLFQSTSYLYFGANIISPARVAPIQSITF
jgi:hypothetical protein